MEPFVAFPLAWLMKAVNTNFNWHYGTLASLDIRALTKSKTTVDFIHGVVPGAPGSTTLLTTMKNFVIHTMSKFEVSRDSTVMGTYDNIPGCDNLGYIRGHSQVSDRTTSAVTVFTGMFAIHVDNNS